MPECLLRAANGTPGVSCDEERCTYWRLVEQIGVDEEPDAQRCAIQHFRMLDGGSEIAEWLLSVKLRVEPGCAGPPSSA
jgi:hypothetical protein